MRVHLFVLFFVFLILTIVSRKKSTFPFSPIVVSYSPLFSPSQFSPSSLQVPPSTGSSTITVSSSLVPAPKVTPFTAKPFSPSPSTSYLPDTPILKGTVRMDSSYEGSGDLAPLSYISENCDNTGLIPQTVVPPVPGQTLATEPTCLYTPYSGIQSSPFSYKPAVNTCASGAQVNQFCPNPFGYTGLDSAQDYNFMGQGFWYTGSLMTPTSCIVFDLQNDQFTFYYPDPKLPPDYTMFSSFQGTPSVPTKPIRSYLYNICSIHNNIINSKYCATPPCSTCSDTSPGSTPGQLIPTVAPIPTIQFVADSSKTVPVNYTVGSIAQDSSGNYYKLLSSVTDYFSKYGYLGTSDLSNKMPYLWERIIDQSHDLGPNLGPIQITATSLVDTVSGVTFSFTNSFCGINNSCQRFDYCSTNEQCSGEPLMICDYTTSMNQCDYELFDLNMDTVYDEQPDGSGSPTGTITFDKLNNQFSYSGTSGAQAQFGALGYTLVNAVAARPGFTVSVGTIDRRHRTFGSGTYSYSPDSSVIYTDWRKQDCSGGNPQYRDPMSGVNQVQTCSGVIFKARNKAPPAPLPGDPPPPGNKPLGYTWFGAQTRGSYTPSTPVPRGNLSDCALACSQDVNCDGVSWPNNLNVQAQQVCNFLSSTVIHSPPVFNSGTGEWQKQHLDLNQYYIITGITDPVTGHAVQGGCFFGKGEFGLYFGNTNYYGKLKVLHDISVTDHGAGVATFNFQVRTLIAWDPIVFTYSGITQEMFNNPIGFQVYYDKTHLSVGGSMYIQSKDPPHFSVVMNVPSGYTNAKNAFGLNNQAFNGTLSECATQCASTSRCVAVDWPLDTSSEMSSLCRLALDSSFNTDLSQTYETFYNSSSGLSSVQTCIVFYGFFDNASDPITDCGGYRANIFAYFNASNNKLYVRFGSSTGGTYFGTDKNGQHCTPYDMGVFEYIYTDDNRGNLSIRIPGAVGNPIVCTYSTFGDQSINMLGFTLHPINYVLSPKDFPPPLANPDMYDSVNEPLVPLMVDSGNYTYFDSAGTYHQVVNTRIQIHIIDSANLKIIKDGTLLFVVSYTIGHDSTTGETYISYEGDPAHYLCDNSFHGVITQVDFLIPGTGKTVSCKQIKSIEEYYAPIPTAPAVWPPRIPINSGVTYNYLADQTYQNPTPHANIPNANLPPGQTSCLASLAITLIFNRTDNTTGNAHFTIVPTTTKFTQNVQIGFGATQSSETKTFCISEQTGYVDEPYVNGTDPDGKTYLQFTGEPETPKHYYDSLNLLRCYLKFFDYNTSALYITQSPIPGSGSGCNIM